MLRIVDAVTAVFDEEADIKKGLEAFSVKFACSGLTALSNITDSDDKDKLEEIRADLAELASLTGNQE